MERPVPIPGWTLPGVMGAAAADVMLKSSNMIPAGRIVLAGPGPFLDHRYCPDSYVRVPRDDTIVCRCEEITAGQIRDAVVRGGVGPNQVKSQTRCGMGLCQGRMCGTVLSEIIADSLKIRMTKVGYYTVRAPIKPIPLGELAEMEILH